MLYYRFLPRITHRELCPPPSAAASPAPGKRAPARPPWPGSLGAAPASALCDDLAARHGPRFKAPDLLHDLAENSDGFYARFIPGAKAA